MKFVFEINVFIMFVRILYILILNKRKCMCFVINYLVLVKIENCKCWGFVRRVIGSLIEVKICDCFVIWFRIKYILRISMIIKLV